MRYAYAFLVLSAAFAALAILVATGTLAGVDQWSVDHLMPGGRFTGGAPTVGDALIPLEETHWDSGWSIAVNIVTLPASFLIALALVAWRSRLLAAVLLVAVAIEVLCKHVLARPDLHHGTVHVVAFDQSFPSGHTLRTLIVAAALGGPLALVWAVVSVALLQLAGWHTPSDIAGGLLLGALALLGARALGGRRLPRRRP